MARNRMIKPEFWGDEKLACLSFEARLTYIALWNFSDDYAVIKGNLRWLKNNIFPYDENLTRETFEEWISELKVARRIVPFEVHGELFLWLPKFLEHQKIKKPSKEKKNPDVPKKVIEAFLNSGGEVGEWCSTGGGVVGNENKIRENKIRENKENNSELVRDYQGIIFRVICRLNEKTKSSYKENQYATQTAIIGLIDSGFSEDDLKTVIDHKCEKWIGDDKMSPFLRPQTLFGDKFEGYLQDARRNGGGEKIQEAKSILKIDGEEAARKYCEKNHIDFCEVEK